MKQYTFNELGYFDEDDIKRIKEALEGKTYMNFHISSSNQAGNHTLIIETDYEDNPQEIKNFFLYCALTELRK